jgi:hypothetical protein
MNDYLMYPAYAGNYKQISARNLVLSFLVLREAGSPLMTCEDDNIIELGVFDDS